MKLKLEFEVTGCNDCPMRKDHSGHGECWDYCSHPDHNQPAYGEILRGCNERNPEKHKPDWTPDWCPIKD